MTLITYYYYLGLNFNLTLMKFFNLYTFIGKTCWTILLILTS